jgi:hypothetical protein
MRENFIGDKNMVKVTFVSKMVRNIEGIFRKIKYMVKVVTFGQIRKHIKGSGKIIK